MYLYKRGKQKARLRINLRLTLRRAKAEEGELLRDPGWEASKLKWILHSLRSLFFISDKFPLAPSRQMKFVWNKKSRSTASAGLHFNLRKRGDSNPRYGYPYVSLANWWFQPLTHPSWAGANIENACFETIKNFGFTKKIQWAFKNVLNISRKARVMTLTLSPLPCP